jgi:hypothetical protein
VRLQGKEVIDPTPRRDPADRSNNHGRRLRAPAASAGDRRDQGKGRNHMKRWIIGLLAGGTVFGVVFAAAALLEVNDAFVQAGGSGELTCQENPVTFANFGVELDTFNLSSFRVHSGDVGGFTACEDGKLIVRLYNAAGNDIGGGGGRTVDPIQTCNGYPASCRIDLTGIDVRNVHEIKAVIQSANP